MNDASCDYTSDAIVPTVRFSETAAKSLSLTLEKLKSSVVIGYAFAQVSLLQSAVY
jgi:hypothetical protein